MKTKHIVALTTAAFVGGYVVARKFGDKVAQAIDEKIVKPIKEAADEVKAEMAGDDSTPKEETETPAEATNEG